MITHLSRAPELDWVVCRSMTAVYCCQVRLPEAAAMAALLRKAEDWVQRAAAAAEVERLPLKRLRDVLHAGTRLAVRLALYAIVDHCL